MKKKRKIIFCIIMLINKIYTWHFFQTRNKKKTLHNNVDGSFLFLLNFLFLFSIFFSFLNKKPIVLKREKRNFDIYFTFLFFKTFLLNFSFLFFTNNRPIVLKRESWTIRKERNLILWSHRNNGGNNAIFSIFFFIKNVF